MSTVHLQTPSIIRPTQFIAPHPIQSASSSSSPIQGARIRKRIKANEFGRVLSAAADLTLDQEDRRMNTHGNDKFRVRLHAVKDDETEPKEGGRELS